ncbi:hypothetical protein AI19_03920 [Thalassolituus oleivorans 4BN06-13]|nr:hypothetical protein [Thalassolituus oleivorans 4BN06-13]
MPKFKPYNYNQTSMVVINYQDQLQLGTFEHAIHYLIDQKLDLSIFNPNYKNDDGGRPAYDPAILLKIILFAYSKASLRVEKFSGAVKPISSLKPCHATACRISPPSPVSSVATRKPSNNYSNRFYWSVISKAC